MSRTMFVVEGHPSRVDDLTERMKSTLADQGKTLVEGPEATDSTESYFRHVYYAE